MFALLRNFEVVAQAVLKLGGQISFEWPDSSEYWRDPVVQNTLSKLGLTFVTIHGCSLGWKSHFGRNGNKGLPDKKPSRIATTSINKLTKFTPCKCPGKSVHPIHAPVEGKDTAASASYTPEFCKLWHDADCLDAFNFVPTVMVGKKVK